MFPPNSNTKVIHKDIWWGDNWDAKDYARDYDFSRSFFEQFAELINSTPYPHVVTFNSENSLYTNYNMDNKNCYLCFAGNCLEDSYYCYNAQNSRDCGDCYYVFNCELCYECVHCTNCYNVKFSLHTRDCTDSAFLEDCSSCQNCFMCWNLNNKQYCLFNQQLSREEYEARVKEYNLEDPEVVQKLRGIWQEERQKFPKPENHNVGTEDCSGEYIQYSKNCHECFITAKNCEDCSQVVNGFPALKDALRCCFSGENSSLMYETIASGADSYNIAFCNLVFGNCNNLFYCSYMSSSKNCFGCSSMRNAEYCILNKQYTKEEYEQLLPQIISHMVSTGEWGQFFPAKYSPFLYELSNAQDYFPKQVSVEPKVAVHPESAEQLSCKDCGKIYKTINPEMQFYQKLKLPLPQKCWDCRHIGRSSLANTLKSHESNCTNCKKSIKTHANANNGAILCKECYLSSIY